MASKSNSALGAVFKAMVGRLTRKGVRVGGTAAYPRVEVHSVTEGEAMDKGGNLRSISCIVESISEERMSEVMTMNEDNLTLVLAELGIDAPWRVVSVRPGQLQELTETSETNAILYRLLQNITIIVERTSK
jgi:hypothetical protein